MLEIVKRYVASIMQMQRIVDNGDVGSALERAPYAGFQAGLPALVPRPNHGRSRQGCGVQAAPMAALHSVQEKMTATDMTGPGDGTGVKFGPCGPGPMTCPQCGHLNEVA